MTGATTPAGGQPPGIIEHCRELLAAALAYLQARAALAGIEAKEAAIHIGIILALAVIAVFVTVFGYLFLCIALTVLIAEWTHISAGWVILGLALLHFVVAVTAILVAVSRLKMSLFTDTLAELQKDRQWLSQTSKQP